MSSLHSKGASRKRLYNFMKINISKVKDSSIMFLIEVPLVIFNTNKSKF